MIPKQMSSDVTAFVEILLKTLKRDALSHGESKIAERFKFKDQFTLNYVEVKDTPTAVQGLIDVVNPESFGKKVIIASGNVEDKASNSFQENEDYTGYHDASNTELNLSQNEQKEIFCNEVDFTEEEVVRAGPSSSSFVYFVNSKTQLQSVSGFASERLISVEDLAPLKLKDARYLLSVYVQAINLLKKQQGKKINESVVIPWLLIKCDKTPPQRINWMYATIHFDKNGVQQKGFLRSFLIKECDILINHEKECQKLLKDETSIVSFMSRYDILGSLLSNADNEKNASSLFLEFAWKDQSLPLEPPPSSADVVIKFRITGDSYSPLAIIFTELTKLDSVIQRVVDHDQLWSDDDNPSNNDNSSIMDNVPGFLDDLMNVKYEEKNAPKKADTTNADEEEDNSPLLTYIHDGFKRSDMDFTDKLWDFIKNAKSMDEVSACLDHIFAAICTREVQPVFSSENKTFFAKLIRDFYKSTDLSKASEELRKELNDFLESEDMLLDLVADIGLEKFRKDYLSFFVNEELATFGQLEPIINDFNSMKEKMSAIWKLHHSLELISIGKAYLNIEIDYLRILLRSCLEYFMSHEADACHPTFSLSIPSVSASASKLKSLCHGIKPETWKMTSVKTKEDTETLSMFILSKEKDKPLDNCTEKVEDTETYKAQCVSENKVRIS